MNLEIKTLYVLLYLLIQVTQNNGSVNVKANNDNPLLLKILQSLDIATSNRKLFEVTLKLLDSVCVCMQKVLRKRKKYMFFIENNSLNTEDDDGRGNKISLYKKIYNKTCIHLRQELEENIKRKHNDSDVTQQRQLDRGTTQRHAKAAAETEKKYFTLLYQSLISTQDYHTYNIHRHNLYKNKLALDNNQEGSVIIIVTLYPDNAKFGLKKTKTLNEYLLNETLHSHTAIDIDIISKSRLQKNGEILKVDKAETCHLYSIYLFLIKSEKENLIHLYKLLSVKGTMKMYIDVLPNQHQADVFSKCCHNDSALISCKKQILSGELEEHSVTSKSEPEDVVSYRDIISNIKVLVEEFKKKVNNHDIATTDNNDDLNYTNDCNIECIYTTEQSEVTSNNKTRKIFESIYEFPIKQPIIQAHPILGITTESLIPSTDILLVIKTNNSIKQIDSILKFDKEYSKALSKSTRTPFHIGDVSNVTKNDASLLPSTIIIAISDKSNFTNSSIKKVDSLNNLTNFINTSNRSLQSKYHFAIKKSISHIGSMFNKMTPSLPTSANTLAIIDNDSRQRNNRVLESEKGYANVVNKSITTSHSDELTFVTKKYTNLFSTTINTAKHDKNIAPLENSLTNVVDLFKSRTQKDGIVDLFTNIKTKENKNTFTITTNKNNYTNRLFDDEIITINPADVRLRDFKERDNRYRRRNTNPKKNNYSTKMHSNSSEYVLFSNQNVGTVKRTTQHNTEQTSYLSNNKSNVNVQFIQPHNDPKTQITLKLTSSILGAKSPIQLKSKNVYQKIFTKPTVFSMLDRSVITKDYKNSVQTESYNDKTKQLNVINTDSKNKEKFDNYKSYTHIFENISSRKIKSHLENNKTNNRNSIQDRAERSSLVHMTKSRTSVSDLFDHSKFTQPYEGYRIITQDNFNKVVLSPLKKTSTIHLKDTNVYQDKLGSTRSSTKFNLPINKITNEHKNITQLYATNNTTIYTLETNDKEKKNTIVFADKANAIVTVTDATKNINTTEKEENTVSYLEPLIEPSEILDYSLPTFRTVLPLIIRKNVKDKTNLQNLNKLNKSEEYTIRNFTNTGIKNNTKEMALYNKTAVLTNLSYNHVETPKVLRNYERQNESLLNALHSNTKLSKKSIENRSNSFKNTYYLMTTELMHKISNKTKKMLYGPHSHNNNKKVTSAVQTIPYAIRFKGLKRSEIRSSKNTFEKQNMTESLITFYNEIKKENYKSTTTSLSQNESSKFSSQFLEKIKTPSISQVTRPNYLDTTIPSNIKKSNNNSNSRNNFTHTYQKEIKNLRIYDSNNESVIGSNRRVNYETATNNINTNFELLDKVLNNLLPGENYTTPLIISKNVILNNENTNLSSVLSTNYETFTLLPIVTNKPGNFELNEILQGFNNSQNQKENEFNSTSSFTTESSFVILETTINNPRTHARIENVSKTNFNQIILNNDTTYLPPEKNKKQSESTDKNFLITFKHDNRKREKKTRQNINTSFTPNSLSFLNFHLDKSSKKPKIGEESITLKNKLNDTDYGTKYSTISSYIHSLKLEGIDSQIDTPTSASILHRYLRTSTIGVMPVYLPSLKNISSILNVNDSKKILIPRKTNSSLIPPVHSNSNEKKITNCSYLEIIQNVQKDKSEQIVITPKEIYQVNDSSDISNNDRKVTSAIFSNNVRNANTTVSLSTSGNLLISDQNQNNYITAFNNASKVIQRKKSTDKFSQFVFTETIPYFKNLNLNNLRQNLNIKSAIIHEKNSNGNINTPQSIHSNNVQSNKTTRNHININIIASKDSSISYGPVTSIKIPVPMKSKNKRNFKNLTQKLNSPALKSMTEANENINKDKYHSHSITSHYETTKYQLNQTIHHSMLSTSSIQHTIYSLLYPKTTIQPKINEKILLLRKFNEIISEKNMESKMKQIDNIDNKTLLNENKSKNTEIGKYRIQSRNNLIQEMHLKNKDKLMNVPSTYTDTYFLNMSINKNQVKKSTIKIKKSSTLTNVSMKDEYNLNKNDAPKIKYEIVQNKNNMERKKTDSFITQKDKLYQNKIGTLKNFGTTLKDANFQNFQEKTDTIFNNTDKIYDGITGKSASLKAIISDNIDIKNFTQKLNSKSTLYSEETYPFPTSPLIYATPLKQTANDKENTTNIPLSYTKMGATAITVKVETLNDTDIKNVMYTFSNKSDLHSEVENSIVTASFKNTKQLQTSVKENTSKISLTYTTILGNRNKIENQEDTIKIKKSLISINNAIKNVSNINNNYTRKVLKLDYDFEKNNNIEKLNSLTTTKHTISKNNFHIQSTNSVTSNSYQDTKHNELDIPTTISKSDIISTNNKSSFPISQVTKAIPITLKIKNNLNLKTTLHNVSSKNVNHHEITDKIILHNRNKIYDRTIDTKLSSSFTTKRTFITFKALEATGSNNAEFENLKYKSNNKSRVNSEYEYSLSISSLKNTTPLKQNTSDKRNTVKRTKISTTSKKKQSANGKGNTANILIPHTKMRPTSKAFNANMLNDTDLHNKDVVYSKEGNTFQSSTKNNKQLTQSANDERNSAENSLTYTKRSTSVETLKAYKSNDIKNSTYIFSNKSAEYSKDARPFISSSFKNTKQWKQNTIGKGNTTKIPVTYMTMLLNNNEHQDEASKLEIKKTLTYTNVKVKDEYDMNNNTTKALQSDYNFVKNEINTDFYESENHESKRTKTKTPLSFITNIRFKAFTANLLTYTYIKNVKHQFGNESPVYSVETNPLPISSLSYTKQLKESANNKENTSPISLKLKYTSNIFKAIKGNILNKTLYSNKNTIPLEQTALQTTAFKYITPSIKIANSQENKTNTKLTKSLLSKPIREKNNKNNSHNITMVTKVEHKTSRFNYDNNSNNKPNKNNISREELRVSHIFETLQTNIYRRSTVKALKKAKTIKYNTYKPTEEDTDFKIRPFTFVSNKVSQRQLKLHHNSLTTKSMKYKMTTKNNLMKIKMTTSPYSIISQTETKNARNSFDKNLLDPFGKTNRYHVVKKPSIKRRKVIRRLHLTNKEKDIPTIVTNDVFSLRKNVNLLQKSPQRLLRDFIQNSAIATPKKYVIHPSFRQIDAAIKSREQYIRPKPLFLAYDKDFYREDYQTHHRIKALSLREKVNHIRDTLPVPPSDEHEQPVIERPSYLPLNSKPKQLRDRIYSIRNYLQNKDLVKSTQIPIKNYLVETTTTYSPFMDPLYYFRRSGWYEVKTSTKEPSTVRPTRRKRRTIYFLSPTVPYYRYF